VAVSGRFVRGRRIELVDHRLSIMTASVDKVSILPTRSPITGDSVNKIKTSAR
jgi:hypothetical protein